MGIEELTLHVYQETVAKTLAAHHLQSWRLKPKPDATFTRPTPTCTRAAKYLVVLALLYWVLEFKGLGVPGFGCGFGYRVWGPGFRRSHSDKGLGFRLSLSHRRASKARQLPTRTTYAIKPPTWSPPCEPPRGDITPHPWID